MSSLGSRAAPARGAVMIGAQVLSGFGLVVQCLVPFTRRGLLSDSSALDGARLLLSGAVGAIAPRAAGLALLVLPVLGLAIALVAFMERRWATRIGYLLWLLATVAAVILATSLRIRNFDRCGPGAALTCAALGVGLLTLVVESWLVHDTRSSA